MSEMCAKTVGKGIQGFLCREEPGHDGPCATVEVPASVIERRRWMAQVAEEAQKVKATREAEEDEAPIKPDIVQSSPMPVSNFFGSYEDRCAQAAVYLRAEMKDLPDAIRSWMIGASSQLALIEIWRAWKRVSEVGGTVLTLTEEDIHQLIPDKLRVDT